MAGEDSGSQEHVTKDLFLPEIVINLGKPFKKKGKSASPQAVKARERKLIVFCNFGKDAQPFGEL